MKATSEYIVLLRNYKRNYADKYGIKRMGIFGSVARGEQSKHIQLKQHKYSAQKCLNLQRNNYLCEPNIFWYESSKLHIEPAETQAEFVFKRNF
jgi:hypothetical protein